VAVYVDPVASRMTKKAVTSTTSGTGPSGRSTSHNISSIRPAVLNGVAAASV
jgi:hypothetical protein